MAMLTCCQNTFQNFAGYEEDIDGLQKVADTLAKQVTQTSAELTKTAGQISGTVEFLKTKADGTSVEELERRVSTVEQDADGLQVTVTSVSASLDRQAQDLADYKAQTSIYLRFTQEGLSIGRQDAGDDSPYAIVIDNEKMSFQQNGMEVAYIQYNKMHINAIEAMDKLSVGAASDGGYFDFISTPQGMGVKWRNV